jgi:hypothetical protein
MSRRVSIEAAAEAIAALSIAAHETADARGKSISIFIYLAAEKN